MLLVDGTLFSNPDLNPLLENWTLVFETSFLDPVLHKFDFFLHVMYAVSCHGYLLLELVIMRKHVDREDRCVDVRAVCVCVQEWTAMMWM